LLGQIRESYAKASPGACRTGGAPGNEADGAREIIEEARSNWCYFYFAWHILSSPPEVPVLDVLAVLLAVAAARGLPAVRERQGLVNSVDAWTYARQSRLVPQRDGDADKFSARDAMLAEVEQMKTPWVAADELGQSSEAIRLATSPCARQCKPGPKTGWKLGWQPMT